MPSTSSSWCDALAYLEVYWSRDFKTRLKSHSLFSNEDLLRESDRHGGPRAIRQYAELSRVEIAAKLKISESALYKKLRL